MKRVNIKKILRILGYLFEGAKYFILYPIGRLLYRNRNIYLFSERGVDARDNALHLYRYFKEKHPELESYFVITKNSPDREKLLSLGNVVNYKSFKHYLLFIGAKYKISTHIMGFSPDVNFYTKFRFKLPVFGKLIFLQHGVIKDDLTGLYSEKTGIDIFICGAKPEFNFIDSTFHYKNGEVKYTGLARFDALYDFECKNQILIMPTWRISLKFTSADGVAKSDYARCWNEVLQSDRLIEFAEKTQTDVVFYPHFEMQPYLHLFKSKSERVKIASVGNYDVQTLLKESRLLVTDFSSVYFDFAYMGKPCVYFQFDRDEFFSSHYSKGYFDYYTMGFGPVLLTADEVVDAVIKSAESSYKLEDVYKKRIGGFFPLHDQNNCERIFNEIERL